MARRRPWWRYVTEVFVRTPRPCVQRRDPYTGELNGTFQTPYSWLWGNGEEKRCD